LPAVGHADLWRGLCFLRSGHRLHLVLGALPHGLLHAHSPEQPISTRNLRSAEHRLALRRRTGVSPTATRERRPLRGPTPRWALHHDGRLSCRRSRLPGWISVYLSALVAQTNAVRCRRGLVERRPAWQWSRRPVIQARCERAPPCPSLRALPTAATLAFLHRAPLHACRSAATRASRHHLAPRALLSRCPGVGAAPLLSCRAPPLARPLWWPSSPNPFSRR
jgi:hypothetical protein